MTIPRLNPADFLPLVLLQGIALYIIQPWWKALLVIPALFAVALPAILYEREYVRRRMQGEPTLWISLGISLYFVLMLLGLAVLHWQRAMESVYG